MFPVSQVDKTWSTGSDFSSLSLSLRSGVRAVIKGLGSNYLTSGQTSAPGTVGSDFTDWRN